MRLQALYPVAYTLKFASKRELSRDNVVPPLEGLWWAEDTDAFTSARDKSRWDWTMMILAPDWIEEPMADTAVEQVATKPAADRPARLGDVRVGTLEEGLCVQTLHIGPYDDEAPVLEAMHYVAMYIGDGKIAHARNPSMGVSITDVDYSPWNMLGTATRY